MASAARHLTSRQRGVLLLLLAAALWSSAGLFSRAVHVDTWAMQFWRAASGAAFMFAVLAFQSGRHTFRALFDIGRTGLLVVPCSAVSMVCYIAALHLTTVAEVMIVYATQPFVNAAMAWLFLREPMGQRTALAALVALAGIGVTIFGGDFSGTGHQRVLGDMIALLMVFGFSAVFIGARGHRAGSMTAVNTLAATLSALLCLPLTAPFALAASDIAMLTAFGCLTLGLGLLLLTAGTRLIPAGEAALVTLLDVPLSPLWVWWLFGETPGASALLGGAIVLAAVVWQISGEFDGRRREA